MKFPAHVVVVLVLTAAGISISDGSASGGPIGNAAGSGYYYQQPQQQQHQGQQWYDQQQGQYVYDEPQQLQPEEQNGADADESPLPAGWSEHIDPESGQPYYYNSNDGTTTWDRPVAAVMDEVKDELQEAPKEEVPSEPRDAIAETTAEACEEEAGSFYFSPEEAQRHASTGHRPVSESRQPEHEPKVEGEPIWGRPQKDEPPTRQESHGWGMPQPQAQKPAAWDVVPEEMHKPEPDYRGETSSGERPHAFQGPLRGGPGGQQPPFGRSDEVQKPGMFPSDAGRPKEVGQPLAQQQPRGWQAGGSEQQKDRPIPGTERRPFGGMPDSQSYLPQTHKSPQQLQQGQGMEQRPPFQQQRPTEQQQQQWPPQQRGYLGQQATPQKQGQEPPQQQQKRPFQQAPPQYGQAPTWQQQRTQQQQPYLQQQQGPPGYGQQPPSGQYGSTQGQGYGQYGGAPGYGQPDGQLVSQGEGGSTVREALGSAWKGILGFSNRTKEVVGQAKETVVSSAAAATQTISTTSQGILGQAKEKLGAVFEGGGDGKTGSLQGYSLSGQYGAPPAHGQYCQQQHYQQQEYPPQQYGGYPPGSQPIQRDIPPYPHQAGPQGQQQPPVQSQWGRAGPQQQPGQPQQSYPPRQQGPYGPGPQGQQYPRNQQGGPQQHGPPGDQQQKPGPDPAQHPGWGSGY